MTRWMILRLVCVVVLGAAAFVSGCGRSNNSNKVRVGSLNSMSGGTSTFGKSTDNGIRLATEEQNKKGGLLGKQIEIVTADTESTTDKTVLAALKLIERDKVCAIVGEVASSRSLAAAPECDKNQVPMLSPASTNPRVTKVGTYIFRSCFTDDFQGVKIAKFTAENLKLKRAAILKDVKSDYSTGLAQVLNEEFPKDGGTIVAEESYSGSDTNFKTQLTNIKNANPEIVFLPGYYTEISLICQQARELGITCPFIGGDGWDSDVTLKSKATEGCYFTNHYFVGDPGKVQEFVQKYRERYPVEPPPDAMAVLGYDAANILFKAIGTAGSTEGPKIRDALAKTKDFPAVTGNITIGADRNARKPGVVLKIESGALKLMERLSPD